MFPIRYSSCCFLVLIWYIDSILKPYCNRSYDHVGDGDKGFFLNHLSIQKVLFLLYRYMCIYIFLFNHCRFLSMYNGSCSWNLFVSLSVLASLWPHYSTRPLCPVKLCLVLLPAQMRRVLILTTISSQATLVCPGGPSEISCLLLSTHGKEPENRLDRFLNTIDTRSGSRAQLYLPLLGSFHCCLQQTLFFFNFTSPPRQPLA